MFRNPEKLSENACAVVFESEPDITEEYGSKVKPVDGFGDALQTHRGDAFKHVCFDRRVGGDALFEHVCCDACRNTRVKKKCVARATCSTLVFVKLLPGFYTWTCCPHSAVASTSSGPFEIFVDVFVQGFADPHSGALKMGSWNFSRHFQ